MLYVDGVGIVAVARSDVARAIDPIPRFTLLPALWVAEHAGNSFLGCVALGDKVAVDGGRLASALRGAAAKSAVSKVRCQAFELDEVGDGREEVGIRDVAVVEPGVCVLVRPRANSFSVHDRTSYMSC